MKKARWISACLIVILLGICAMPAFAFEEGLVADRYWALGGEVKIRFKVIDRDVSEKDFELFVSSCVDRAPWKNNLKYAPYNQYKMAKPEEAEVIDSDVKKKEFTVIFHKPGRYFVSMGSIVDIYIFDPNNKTLKAVAKELSSAAETCRAKTEKKTAALIRNWIVKTIQYGGDDTDFPERGQYEDPIGALISGKAVCVGYARLFQLMAETCGIRTLAIGAETKKGEGHMLNLSRLDGVWSYTDVTWDDGGKTSRNTYFAMDRKKAGRYYTTLDYEYYRKWFSSSKETNKLNKLLDGFIK